MAAEITEGQIREHPYTAVCQLEGEKPFGKFVVREGIVGRGWSKDATGVSATFVDSLGRFVVFGEVGGSIRLEARGAETQTRYRMLRGEVLNERDMVLVIADAVRRDPRIGNFLSTYTVGEGRDGLPNFTTESIPFPLRFVSFVNALREIRDDKMSKDEKRLLFLHVLKQGMQGMQALNDIGVVHGDAKLNIFVSMQTGQVRVGDYGRSRVVRDAKELGENEKTVLIEVIHSLTASLFKSSQYLSEGLHTIQSEDAVRRGSFRTLLTEIDQQYAQLCQVLLQRRTQGAASPDDYIKQILGRLFHEYIKERSKPYIRFNDRQADFIVDQITHLQQQLGVQ